MDVTTSPRRRPPGRAARLRDALRRLTASTTAGGVMLVGLPFALDYVVRPGDTLSEIAARHDTSVQRIAARNDLPASGHSVLAGTTLRIPTAHRRAAAASQARPKRHRISPDRRRIVRYTVRPGDTPSGLAVRFHAWTAELIALNGSVLRVGDRIRIPVVVAAAAKDRRAKAKKVRNSPRKADRHQARKKRRQARITNPSRAQVRRVLARTSRRHGVDPQLTLAVSWQESGWQMDRVSSAGAIGAMQVMPDTGRWMSSLVGRRLKLRRLGDNATAGVVLLKILRNEARLPVAIAGYYQGLAGVRRHGMYSDTKRYVANVLALRRAFERGDYPA